MTFRYDYVPEEQMDSPKEVVLLEEGEGSYQILKAGDHLSKTGNTSLKLEIEVTDSRRNRAILYEYLTPQAGWKIKQLADSIGAPDLYNARGVLSPRALINQRGLCTIKTRTHEGFGDKSSIAKFLPPSGGQKVAAGRPRPVREEDDDIPF